MAPYDYCFDDNRIATASSTHGEVAATELLRTDGSTCGSSSTVFIVKVSFMVIYVTQIFSLKMMVL